MKDLRPTVNEEGKVVASGKVIRRTVGVHDRRRRLVVSLEPGDVLGIREERRRKWFKAPLGRIYTQIVMWNVDAERREKAVKRKLARQLRASS